MNFTRKTVAETVTVSGIGLHSGIPVTLSIHPGESGIAFRYGTVRTPAKPENVTDTARCTRLGEVQTIEHLMAAFAGLEVTDAEVELSAAELPGMDGSAKLFVEAILAVGLVTVGEAELPALFTRVFVQEEGIKIAIAKGAGHWRFVYDTGDRWPGSQPFEALDAVEAFVQEIAPARTFALAEEIPMLIEHGLGRGLDAQTALILGIDGYKNEARFPEEPARHKLLDAMGDLYLSGVPIRCLSVVAERSGHRSHVRAAQMLAQALVAPKREE
jgi:UDP-3-O-acyl-N-acetylglucosamine deacetylase